MGRRAKKTSVVTKRRPKLAQRFKCPFCANDDTVECKMDHRAGIGSLNCRLCGAAYQMPINHLHEPVDVFSEWLDDCETAAQQQSVNNTAANNNNALRYDDEEQDEEDEAALAATLARVRAGNNTNTGKNSESGTGAGRSIELGDEDSDDD